MESATFPDEHFDHTFVYKVDRLRQLLSTEPMTDMICIDAASVLRTLLDEQIPQRVAKRCRTPLLVLVPESSIRNPRYPARIDIPARVARYAVPLDQSPPGFFLCPYELEAYLDRPAAVVFHKPITPKHCIKYLANKLGGIHMDPKLTDEPGKPPHATLHKTNRSVFIGNEPAVFSVFRGAAGLLWRSFAPLRDEILEAHANTTPTGTAGGQPRRPPR
jgi:hypothetical protein